MRRWVRSGYVPGVWIRVHHLDLGYYDQLFKDGYTETHRRHQELRHSQGDAARQTPA